MVLLMVTAVFTLAIAAVINAALYRRALLVATVIVACSLAGGLTGWMLRPPGWRLSLRQTAAASVNARRYGHPLESQAERVLLYPLECGFLAAVGSSAVAMVAVNLGARRRPAG
ncbi:MAG TPA: hypothetical protein VLY04_07860 [Bryobacteraceae bacterium]|nr:hypothetical protein [Bryobacteraceae bacterium]